MLTYVNAGHNAPMVFRGDKVLRLEDGGPVVGLFKPARYAQAALGLEVGDILVLFTDGISEAMNAADEEWGEDRLIEAISRCHDQPANGIIDSIVRGADGFVGSAPQHDDMTLVVVKVIETRA